MQKKQCINIIIWSTIALIVPVFGQLFVNGWNWGLGEFLFAWVFFNIFGFTYTIVTNKFVSSRSKLIAATIIVILFVLIWVRLATG